ncbi:MAG TPA: hypothetical protein PK926_07685 [Spirochaetota bacterium]|nr:hypothetical protein [Spirochaetota bacterium]HPI90745.1 hypothetical protein [Spirochaetota bacterium]HPR46351.1 hypothetical protein [Spirochaetota bacterium]
MHIKRTYFPAVLCCLSFIVIHFCSCYTYREVVVKRSVAENANSSLFSDLSSSGSGVYSWRLRNKKQESTSVTKQYIVMSGGGPVAEMNNHAVSLALNEEFFQAEIILKEAIREKDDEAALYNNLGLVSEMTANNAQASSSYLRACLLNASDMNIRRNFLTGEETNK